MACEHKRLKCTNNVFFCLDCGAMVPNPYEAKKPAEAQKPCRKRKAKGADGNEKH
jgi:hypothetical protein